MSNPVSTPAPAKSVLADGQALAIVGAMIRFLFSGLFRADNVRTKATEQIPAMVESLIRNGFKPNHPLVVSIKADGRALVLCGNRRTMALEFLAANNPAEFSRILPDGMVPVVAYYNLTAEQEAILRIDHGSDEDRVPLDAYGEFLAVRQLVKAGYDSESGIAEKLGKFHDSGKNIGKPNRSWVQPRVALAQLPAYVQAEFAKLWQEGASSTPVRVGMILKPLYATFNEEYRNFPDGNGPQFAAVWAECLGKVHTVAAKPVIITPKECLERSKHVGSRNLRETLKLVAGQGADGMTLADVDAAMIAAECAAATLAEIANYLGERDYADLVKQSREAAAAQAAADAGKLAIAPAAPATLAAGNGTESNLSAQEIAEIVA